MKINARLVLLSTILAAAAGCKPTVGRYQITTISGETATVARLDTVTGEVIVVGFTQGGQAKQLMLLSADSAQNPPKP